MAEGYILKPFDPEHAFEDRELEFLKPASSGDRTDYFWARVSPRFEANSFSSVSEPVEIVFLATRHQDKSLKAITGPTHVYVCVPKTANELLADRIEPDNLLILIWALVVPVK